MRPVLVGIGGGTASGKSTVAAALAETLGDACLLVLHDRYYRSLPQDLRHDPIRYNFDHPDALETPRLVDDLALLRQGRPARLPVYDYARHERHADEEPVDPRPVIVVEGILVLADPALRGLFDHRVYVHTDDDLRLARRVRRDIKKRGRTIEDVLDQYERTVRPMHLQYVAPSRAHADLVLDGTAPLDRLVRELLALPGLAERV